MSQVESTRAGLDVSLDTLREALDFVLAATLRSAHDSSKPILPTRLPSTLEQALLAPLPEVGTGLAETAREILESLYPHATRTSDPRFLGLVSTGGNPYGTIAAMLAAPLNQHVARAQISPLAAAIENTVVRWMGEFIRYGPAEGVLTSGGSTANLTALAAAVVDRAGWDVREDGMAGGPPLIVYTSDQAHQSVDKAIAVLGMGIRNLRKLPAREDFTLDVETLALAVARDRRAGLRPICVVAQGGAVNTGAVDPLADLAGFCREQDLWLHVDAAYGGPAAAAPTTSPQFHGLSEAQSVTVDAHKWLYTPYEAACVLVRDAQVLKRAFQFGAPYAASAEGACDPMDLGLQMSRDFKALKVWGLFRGAGAAAVRRAIEDDVQTIRRLVERIDAHPRLQRMAPAPLSTVCFRFVPEKHHDDISLDALNTALADAIRRDGRVFVGGTSVRGQAALRACCVNYRFDDAIAAEVVEVVDQVGRTLLESAVRGSS